MSQLKMLKNEKKNRRKAFVITTFFYLALIGGLVAYTSGTDFSQILPDKVQEWLPGQDTPTADNKDRV